MAKVSFESAEGGRFLLAAGKLGKSKLVTVFDAEALVHHTTLHSLATVLSHSHEAWLPFAGNQREVNQLLDISREVS